MAPPLPFWPKPEEGARLLHCMRLTIDLEDWTLRPTREIALRLLAGEDVQVTDADVLRAVDEEAILAERYRRFTADVNTNFPELELHPGCARRVLPNGNTETYMPNAMGECTLVLVVGPNGETL